jgi:peptidylprolyl isomerase
MNGKSIIYAVVTLGVIVEVFYYFTKSSPVSSPPVVFSTITPGSPPVTIAPMDKLEIQDLRVGTGSAVKAGDTVVVHYTGTLTNGKKFDSSLDRGQPFSTKIGTGQVISGWDQGIPGMKVGGTRRLLIPSALGYGSRDMGNIPPDSDLIFEVELLEIR